MELVIVLLSSIYDRIVNEGFIYFKVATLTFLLFWVVFKQKVAHFRIQPKRRTNSKIIFTEIKNSLITFIVGGGIAWISIVLLGGRAGLFYNNFYANLNDYGWGYFFLSIFGLLVLDDTYFYWSHRLLHHPKIFPHIHQVHHRSFDPTPFTTYSFHPVESFILIMGQWVVMSLFPVHELAVTIWLFLTMMNSIVIHLGYEIYPYWFTQFWLTKWKTPSTHHNLHHEKVKGNYALIFTWWDQWMGTEFPDYEAKVNAVQERKAKSRRRVAKGMH